MRLSEKKRKKKPVYINCYRYVFNRTARFYVFIFHADDVWMQSHFLQNLDAQVDTGHGYHVVHYNGRRTRVGQRDEMFVQRILLKRNRIIENRTAIE